jgi:hypothetical protein
MSELEEVLDDESRFEVVRCNGRGGRECRLVGAVIFFKPSVEDVLQLETVNAEEKQREPGFYRLRLYTDDVFNG